MAHLKEQQPTSALVLWRDPRQRQVRSSHPPVHEQQLAHGKESRLDSDPLPTRAMWTSLQRLLSKHAHELPLPSPDSSLPPSTDIFTPRRIPSICFDIPANTSVPRPPVDETSSARQDFSLPFVPPSSCTEVIIQPADDPMAESQNGDVFSPRPTNESAPTDGNLGCGEDFVAPTRSMKLVRLGVLESIPGGNGGEEGRKIIAESFDGGDERGRKVSCPDSAGVETDQGLATGSGQPALSFNTPPALSHSLILTVSEDFDDNPSPIVSQGDPNNFGHAHPTPASDPASTVEAPLAPINLGNSSSAEADQSDIILLDHTPDTQATPPAIIDSSMNWRGSSTGLSGKVLDPLPHSDTYATSGNTDNTKENDIAPGSPSVANQSTPPTSGMASGNPASTEDRPDLVDKTQSLDDCREAPSSHQLPLMTQDEPPVGSARETTPCSKISLEQQTTDSETTPMVVDAPVITCANAIDVGDVGESASGRKRRASESVIVNTADTADALLDHGSTPAKRLCVDGPAIVASFQNDVSSSTLSIVMQEESISVEPVLKHPSAPDPPIMESDSRSENASDQAPLVEYGPAISPTKDTTLHVADHDPAKDQWRVGRLPGHQGSHVRRKEDMEAMEGIPSIGDKRRLSNSAQETDRVLKKPFRLPVKVNPPFTPVRSKMAQSSSPLSSPPPTSLTANEPSTPVQHANHPSSPPRRPVKPPPKKAFVVPRQTSPVRVASPKFTTMQPAVLLKRSSNFLARSSSPMSWPPSSPTPKQITASSSSILTPTATSPVTTATSPVTTATPSSVRASTRASRPLKSPFPRSSAPSPSLPVHSAFNRHAPATPSISLSRSTTTPRAVSLRERLMELEKEERTLKQAIRFLTSPEEDQRLADLIPMWRTAGRTVAELLFDITPKPDLADEARARVGNSMGMWNDAADRGTYALSDEEKALIDEVATNANGELVDADGVPLWGEDDERDLGDLLLSSVSGSKRGQSRPRTRSNMYIEPDSRPASDSTVWNIGSMLRRIGADLELFGWDDEDEDWKEIENDAGEEEGGVGMSMDVGVVGLVPLDENDDSWME